jgi:hypothetical protein
MAEFTADIQYVARQEDMAADALSRVLVAALFSYLLFLVQLPLAWYEERHSLLMQG